MADAIQPAVSQSRKQADPELKDLLDLFSKQIKLDMNCVHLATIQSFDSEKQTVTATINYKKTYFEKQTNGTYVPVLRDYPLLLDVPAVVLTGGAFSLKMPITTGDTCLVLFNDRSIDGWFQSGQIAGCTSSRLHSFSDGLALVGVRCLNNLLSGYSEEQVVLGDETTELILGDGEATLKNGTTFVTAHATKVLIRNAGTTLNTQLQALTTELQNLVTQIALLTVTCSTPGNPSSIPINAAAITAIGAQIAATATNIGNLLE